MKVLIDTREQRPFTFENYDVVTASTTLVAGDYSVQGFEDCVAVERKELGDLVNCLMGKNRDRFEKELQKLRYYELATVVVESPLRDVAAGNYRSEMKPNAVIQSCLAFWVRYGVPFVFAESRVNAEYIVHSLLQKYTTEIEKRYARLCKA